MDNYEIEALWEAEHDMRTIGEPQDDDETNNWNSAMEILYPEIDRDDNFDQ